MVDPVMIVGWFLTPVISFAVNKALEYLDKPLKRASAYNAKLSKLEVLLRNITPLVAKVDEIKVVDQHQIKLRRKLTKAVLEAERDTLNFNGHYRQLLKLEEAEVAGKKSVVKRWQVFFSVLGLQKNLSNSIKGWQRVERIAKDFIRQSRLQSTTSAHEGREVVKALTDDSEHILTLKRKRDTEADLPNKKMKINGFKGIKERAENGEGINPIIHRERMDSQIVEFGRTPLEMCQYAKEVFDKSCPSPLREKYAAARMAKAAFEVGVAAATLWQRCQELDLTFEGKVLPPQIENKDLEDDKSKSEEGSSSKD